MQWEDATVLSARVRCERGHGAAGWPLLGGDKDAVGALVRGRCPICPDEPLDTGDDAARVTAGTRLCCGSGWRLTNDDLDWLPGARSRVTDG
jgi:hypothetical protein